MVIKLILVAGEGEYDVSWEVNVRSTGPLCGIDICFVPFIVLLLAKPGMPWAIVPRFLKTVSVRTSRCVCVFVCVSAPKAITN